MHGQGASSSQLIQRQVAMVGQLEVASHRIRQANQSEAQTSDLRV
jgi:hypothetical protein